MSGPADAAEHLMANRAAYSRVVATADDWEEATDQDLVSVGATLGCLIKAEPYWVSREICEVIAASATALPDWTLRADLFPTLSGFVWFEAPLPLPHGVNRYGEGLSASLRAIGWAGSPEQITITSFVDAPGAPHGLDVLPGTSEVFGLPAAQVRQSAMRAEPLLPNQERSQAASERFDTMLAFLGTLLLFIEQRIAITSQERAGRSARRRANTPLPAVIVVRLRRTAQAGQAGATGGTTDWRVRWMVRGHWRQQFHPSDHSHRPRWIRPYPKGPEGKPWKESRRLFEVVR